MVAVVSQGISRLNDEHYFGFPPPLGSQYLRSRIACLMPVFSKFFSKLDIQMSIANGQGVG